jgi:hypothetical protein
MGETADRLSREERLALKLRENLRRRKAQSRAMESRALDEAEAIPPEDGPYTEGLSKEPGNS